MKKLILLCILIFQFISVGCNATQGNSSGNNVNDKNNNSLGNTVSSVNNGGVTQDGIEVDNSGYENYFIDFSHQVNWGMAYHYMQVINKPVKEIADNYINWECEGTIGGSVVYSNPVNNFQYWFNAIKSTDEYYHSKLSGDEICNGIGVDVGTLFPDAVWPQTLSETLGYLHSYLGLDFVLCDGTDVDGSGYSYFVYLEKNNCTIGIYADDGLIRPETGITIYGESMVLQP